MYRRPTTLVPILGATRERSGDLVPGWLLAVGATLALGVALTRTPVRRNDARASRREWVTLRDHIQSGRDISRRLGARATRLALGAAYDAWIEEAMALFPES